MSSRIVKNLKKVQLIILILSFVFVCGISCLLLVFIFSNLISPTYDDRSEYYEYQTLQVNPSRNETSVGYSRILKYLEPNEFISYDNGDLYTLISNYGENEYACTGVCYCDEQSSNDDRRIAAASSSRKVLMYLVAAVSSYSALQIAKKHFYETCENQMLSEGCIPDRIRVEEDDCQQIGEELIRKYDELVDEGSSELSIESLKGDYVCKGYCIPHGRKLKGITQEWDSTLEGFCATLYIQTYLEFDPEVVYKEHTQNVMNFFHDRNMLPSEAATLMFSDTTLDPYCKRNSMEFGKMSEVEYNQLDKKMRKFARKNREIEFCWGVQKNVNTGDIHYHKENKCKKVFNQKKM